MVSNFQPPCCRLLKSRRSNHCRPAAMACRAFAFASVHFQGQMVLTKTQVTDLRGTIGEVSLRVNPKSDTASGSGAL